MESKLKSEMNFVGIPTNLISDEVHRPTQGGTQIQYSEFVCFARKKGPKSGLAFFRHTDSSSLSRRFFEDCGRFSA